MAGLLGDIYSYGDSLKRKVKGLLADPVGTVSQMAGQFNDDMNTQIGNMRSGYGFDGGKSVLASPEQQAGARRSLADYGANMGIAGVILKNPPPFNVAHGSKETFDKFERGRGVTAEHIYTTPDSFVEDAASYGKNVYAAQASPSKLIDFSSYEKLDKPTISAMKKAAKDAGITDKYHSFDEFLQNAMDGQLYQYYGNQRTQNQFLNELFDKFDAVKMPDAGMNGSLSQSVVFQNPDILKIMERNGQPMGGLLK